MPEHKPTNPAAPTTKTHNPDNPHHRKKTVRMLGNGILRNEFSRQKFSNSFVRAMASDFDQFGVAAIKRVRSRYPAVYLKVCALILPKEVAVKDDIIGRLSDEQLGEYLNVVSKLVEAKKAELAARGEPIDVTPASAPVRKGLRPMLLADDEDIIEDNQSVDDDSSDNGRSMIDPDC